MFFPKDQIEYQFCDFNNNNYRHYAIDTLGDFVMIAALNIGLRYSTQPVV